MTIPRGGSCGSLFADRIGMWNFSFCVFVGLNNTVLPILVKCFVQVTNLYSRGPVLPLFIMVCFLFVFVLFLFCFLFFVFVYLLFFHSNSLMVENHDSIEEGEKFLVKWKPAKAFKSRCFPG